MKVIRKILYLILFISLASGYILAQNISDEQIIQLIQQGNKSGKSQQQITTELASKGVTASQIEKIKQKYEAKNKNGVENNLSTIDLSNQNTNSNDYNENQINNETDINTPILTNGKEEKTIFGKSIFNNKNLSFEPNSNIATPTNYKLGPGDQVVIDIWGASQNTFTETITPDGNIKIKNLGPVYLNGLTIKEANEYVQAKFSSIYSGIMNNSSSNIKLTLGQIRSIQINIMGEVSVPGTYTLSSFSSVFHALYRAGGINPIGSLRNIRVVRDNKIIAQLDIYDFILNGKLNNDIRLMEGDVIIVPPYENLVNISGFVKRPMFYEMKNGETAATLLSFAGGFSGSAYTKKIQLIRKIGNENKMFTIDNTELTQFELMDGDSAKVDSVLNRYENRVEIKGAVYRSGFYEINNETKTVIDLIKQADGLTGDAFLNRAELVRQHDDLTLETISIDLNALLNGTSADITLMKNDVLTIASSFEIKEAGTLTIHGEVANPGVYPFARNTTIEDMVIISGGLLDAASTVRIDVARRIKDSKSTNIGSKIGKTFSFSLKDGLLVSGNKDFILEPFDEIYVRRSPGYHIQQNVMISGEVVFTGNHALTTKNERLSDMIRKAGGITPDAYPEGARLIRKMNEEELARANKTIKVAKQKSIGKDSIQIENLEVDSVYTVGIQLEKALNMPGSDFDLVMREGDNLIIPQQISTVKINGAVMYPNTVFFEKGKKLKHYINQAGGYDSKAKKNKAYVVYMNGTVAQLGKGNNSTIEPGCEIIIPTKEEKKGISLAEIISISSSTASLAAVVASLISLLK